MAGDLSLAGHTLTWNGPIKTIGEEVIFNGSNTSLSAPDSASWLFAGNFTIDIFGIKFTSVATTMRFFNQHDVNGNQRSWSLVYSGAAGTPQFRIDLSTNGSSETSVGGNWTPTVDQAYNLRAKRNGSTVRLYIDGVFLAKGTVAGSLHNSSALLMIGGVTDGGSGLSFPFAGRMKAFRIYNGTAKGTDTDDNYTVEDLPLPTS